VVFRRQETPVPTAAPRRATLDKILVKGAHRVRLLPVDQISWIEADGMYVKLHTRDGAAHLHRELLGSLDRSLDSRRFVRVHRSAIVNIDLVDELRQDAHGDYVLVLRDRTELRVGRRFGSGCRYGSDDRCSSEAIAPRLDQ
jgi:two-component system, LytTR family, response regulator